MSKKILFAAAFAALAFAQGAKAQNVQLFYDFGDGRNYVTTTFEMFKGDKERGINFWQDTNLKDLSAHLEYDGSTWGAGIWCFGAKYFLHNSDFSNTFTLALMYDLHRGLGEADIPIKFSGVWGMNDIFDVKGLVFKGFIDIWGLNSTFANGNTAKFSILTEPQVWFNLGGTFDNHLDIGTEIELSYNFAGNEGFMCNPCAGLRWTF